MAEIVEEARYHLMNYRELLLKQVKQAVAMEIEANAEVMARSEALNKAILRHREIQGEIDSLRKTIKGIDDFAK